MHNAQSDVWVSPSGAQTGAALLHWRGATLRDHVTAPETPNHVWLAPRAARSEPLTVGSESEQYLFYRGMANLDAPIRAQIAGSGEVRLRGPKPARWFTSPTLALGHVWLVDIGRQHRLRSRRQPVTSPSARAIR